MLQELRERLSGKRAAILGIGNPLRGDDGLGPHLASRLKDKVDALVLDVGEVPENYLGLVISAIPEVVILVDAIELKDRPGAIAIVEVNALEERCYSTHNASLSLFVKALCAEIQTDVFLLGVQPETIAWGAPISQTVIQALETLERLLLSTLPEAVSIV